MKKPIVFIILAIVMVALIAVAAFAYRRLSEDYYSPSETTAAETTALITAAETTAATTAEIELAPDFTVTDKDGKAVKLSDFIGKPTVVNFWASWCSPCTSEMPHFEEAYLAQSDDVNFVMVNVGDSYEDAYKFANRKGYSFPVYHDSSYEASYAYGVSSIPMTLFIDKNGVLVNYKIGSMNKMMLDTYIGAIK